MLDRIDICVEASPVSYGDIRSSGKNESSCEIRSRVEQARKIQRNVLRMKISAATAKCQDAISGNSADSDGKRKRL